MQQHGQLETDAFQYSAMKRCSMCMQNQSVDQFHKNCGSSDGLRTNCKSCHAEYRLKKRRGDKDEGGEDGDTDKTENDGMTENDDKTENDSKTEDSLYFLSYDFDTECIKIGRSSNVQQRIKDLEASQNFRIQLWAEFPGLGHLESTMHTHLQCYRSTRGRGREWFKTSFGHAMSVLTMLLNSPNHELCQTSS